MMPFDSLSKDYERFRPRYPHALLQAFARQCRGRAEPRTIIDVGCGTGISTRAIRNVFGSNPQIHGIEPAAGMVAEATSATDDPGIRFVLARAERIPAHDESADVVFAAQAIQWFDRPRFYEEVARILVPRTGMLGVAQNNRAWSGNAFLEAYERLLEKYSPGYTRVYRAFDIERELRDLPWIDDVIVTTERWTMVGSTDDFAGLAFSSTKMKAAVEANGIVRMRAAIGGLARTFAADGVVSVPYVTELYSGCKA